MLTALSVARECGLVGAHDKVVSIKATPPQGDNPATCVFESTTSMVSHFNCIFGGFRA